ncbi:hypothetical protein T484DRAFT_1852183 [Baffinella frigidus]|nr:hypothetical protein T484DRAFT_1852183 [Cryptophyta sp. CCMP2293]
MDVHGDGGARLSHSHEKQYGYVLQSLSLWREIAHDILWCLSEEDLLASDTRYELRDTGQGRQRVVCRTLARVCPTLSQGQQRVQASPKGQQRVQASPKVSRAMRNAGHWIGSSVVGHWIGSSVVHLGDNNVPNALVFIDKYTQVSCILSPIRRI